MSEVFWVTGEVQSGKTRRLIEQFQNWVEGGEGLPEQQPARSTPALTAKIRARRRCQSILVFAESGDSRIRLVDRLGAITEGSYTVNSTTPLSFFQDEVLLFWPLLVQVLSLPATLPLRLRPENEQELATRCWQFALDAGQLQMVGVPRQQLVRRLLDLIQLAAFSGTPIAQIAQVLESGQADPALFPSDWQSLGRLLVNWRDWCWQRGLLTYGLLTELYWRYLLPHPDYQAHLQQRYRGILADDVDNYPAIARDLFELLLDQGAAALFTFNSQGGMRQGLGADPNYLLGLSQRCQSISLTWQPLSAIGNPVEAVIDPLLQAPGLAVPEGLPSIQTVARSQLLRQVADTIIEAIHTGEIEPQEIAVLAPGLDAIARYTLIEILNRQNVPVIALNHQRPLISSALIRGLLTLLALVYPGCGRLVEPDQVAEMLVVLSGTSFSDQNPFAPRIDPVRAGLLADHCFQPHPQQPRLLPVNSFGRWDRLGYTATQAYGELWQWLEQQQTTLQGERPPQPYLTLSPVFMLDRAIQQFLWPNNLNYQQLAVLRELMETAQHYWAVSQRLRQLEPQPQTLAETISQFIQLLRAGTITANPLPLRPGQLPRAVTLATTFQYRSDRSRHRWQFWLDVGGQLWQGGGAVVLWGAPLFLKTAPEQPPTLQDQLQQDQQQLRRLLLDLCRRAGERIYLCHSDLSVTGQEQMGPLLPWVEASAPLSAVL